jgi:hypothetical protein
MDIMLHPIVIYLEDLACVDVGQCNDGRVGVSFVGVGLNNNQWDQQCKRPR